MQAGYGQYYLTMENAELPPDVNRGPEILGICGTLVAFALVMVVLRIWVRASMIRHVGWDDYIMIAAMVSIFLQRALTFNPLMNV